MPLPPNTLNQALDQLPQLLLSLGRLQQDRRDEELRRDIQQASQDFQAEMLTKRIAAEKELTKFKAGLEQPKDPPEAAILGRRIEKDLDILRDPNIAFDLNEDEINAVKSRVTSNLAERRRLSGRDYPVDPSLIEVTKPEPEDKPLPLAAPPTVEPEVRPKPRIFESRDEYQQRLREFEAAKAPGLEEEITAEDVVVIETDEDFNALPSGTVFIGPDGVKRTKP